MSSESNSPLGTYRLGGGRVVGWWIIGLMVLMAVAGLMTETGRNRIVSVALCLVVIAISYLLGVRPCVMELPAELMVCNPIRTARIPWAAISDVVVKDVVIIETGEREVRCYGLPRRERRSAAASINASINSRLSAGGEVQAMAPGLSGTVVDRIRAHVELLSGGSSREQVVQFTVDRDVRAALILSVVALVSVVIAIWA